MSDRCGAICDAWRDTVMQYRAICELAPDHQGEHHNERHLDLKGGTRPDVLAVVTWVDPQSTTTWLVDPTMLPR